MSTYTAVCIAWVFFRASDFTIATRMLRGMFGGHPHGDAILATREMLQIGIVTFFMMIAHWSLRDISIEHAVERLPRWLVTSLWTAMACAIILNSRKRQCIHLLPVLILFGQSRRFRGAGSPSLLR